MSHANFSCICFPGDSIDGHQMSIESSLWESACWKLGAELRSEDCKEAKSSKNTKVSEYIKCLRVYIANVH